MFQRIFRIDIVELMRHADVYCIDMLIEFLFVSCVEFAVHFFGKAFCTCNMGIKHTSKFHAADIFRFGHKTPCNASAAH